MVIKCKENDFKEILEIINDGASAYRGIIPADRWKEPYMEAEELKKQISEGVEFWCYTEGNTKKGVMGIQNRSGVTLIRHAYVRTYYRNNGIGGKLLGYLRNKSRGPILIGTWADADWAIRFYQKHGFYLLTKDERINALRKYWTIPERQIETSVVLTNSQPIN